MPNPIAMQSGKETMTMLDTGRARLGRRSGARLARASATYGPALCILIAIAVALGTMHGALSAHIGAAYAAQTSFTVDLLLDPNISINGAHIVVNGVESAAISSDDAAQTLLQTPNVVNGLRGHIAFLYVKKVRVTNVLITDLLSKDYGIQVSDFEDVCIENVHIEGSKDGVHFGPGKQFVLRNGKFRTGDDAIALNCADYSVSNPNFGTISDGLIENCTELPGAESSLFIRILVGTARDWTKGMTVRHSDAVRTRSGMYRVVMRPDDMTYVSETEPCFEDVCKELDGILWVRTHIGYAKKDIPLSAGCRNILFRNIMLENPRNLAVLIYKNDDAYLHSWYPGSEIPPVENIRFEHVQILKPIDRFLRIETPADNVTVEGGNAPPAFLEDHCR